MSIQNSITTQYGAAVRTPKTTPFCMFIFIFLNLELKEKKKNIKGEQCHRSPSPESKQMPSPITDSSLTQKKSVTQHDE